jgi:hypothetical protein
VTVKTRLEVNKNVKRRSLKDLHLKFKSSQDFLKDRDIEMSFRNLLVKAGILRFRAVGLTDSIKVQSPVTR